MPDQESEELEISDEQFQILRDLGVDIGELQGMSMAAAEDLIDELRSMQRPTEQR